MKNRIGKLIESSNVNDFVCTIHGFCVKFRITCIIHTLLQVIPVFSDVL